MSNCPLYPPGLYTAQPVSLLPIGKAEEHNDIISLMDHLTLDNCTDAVPVFEPCIINPTPSQLCCACTQCKCTSLPRTAMVYVSNSGHTSVEPQPTLCLVCERLELWGKNDLSYEACKCECRCRLQRVDGELQCGDCLVRNQENPHRHRPHGKA
ncbi:hypothetical protein F4814DRAFT_399168 [Daldinia grandis]|nr:hypothetical protein F4814DRAFT_399168 [Daldinia grandis]